MICIEHVGWDAYFCSSTSGRFTRNWLWMIMRYLCCEWRGWCFHRRNHSGAAPSWLTAPLAPPLCSTKNVNPLLAISVPPLSSQTNPCSRGALRTFHQSCGISLFSERKNWGTYMNLFDSLLSVWAVISIQKRNKKALVTKTPNKRNANIKIIIKMFGLI